MRERSRARTKTAGLFQAAHGGTLYGQIGNMNLAMAGTDRSAEGKCGREHEDWTWIAGRGDKQGSGEVNCGESPEDRFTLSAFRYSSVAA